jgi:chorismate synthase
LDIDAIQSQLQRRRPGQSAITTARNETDNFQILSGLYEGKTLGSPLCIFIANRDQKPEDYDALTNVYRPGHADFTYDAKYGHRDPRGGGRSSARVTAGWVAAGAIAEQLLQKELPIEIAAWADILLREQNLRSSQA